MLSDFLNEKTILLNVEAVDRYHAIEAAGALLVKNDFVSEKYIENMKKSLDELGPYMVISPGIAFAHAQPDENVYKDCISMITLRNPVEFGNEKNDPVKVVFALAGKTSKNHLSVMREVSLLITRPDFFEKAAGETDIDSIVKYIISI